MTNTSIHAPTDLSRAEVATILGCVTRVLLDSNRTEDIVTAEEVTARKQLAYLLESGVMETADGPDLMRERPDFQDLDLDELRKLPEGTLGRALAHFFDDNGLDTKLYGIPCEYVTDPEQAYLMRRIRQCHDLWHVLTGFRIDGHEEVLLHAFQLAQTGLPSSVALLALGSIKHMVLEARWGCMRTGILAAYRRGQAAEPLLAVYWERLLEEPLDEVRARFGIRPWTEADRQATLPFRFTGPAIAA